ncbi:MAG TPA: DUF4255 domain-containing protein [Candidatus Limnocylindrales bacterium]|nr:DUF4255 domain-containing protein [Candidatus Limnocylindrales bacterium]
MIHEVDEALRRLIRDEALRGSQVEVALEAPTKDWAARRNAPTVNIYLYDIREDLRRKSRGEEEERDETGSVTARRKPPRYAKLSYLVTAWTQRPEDEHRLLSLLLAGLFGVESLPPRLLTGSLAQLKLPVPLTVALPPPEDRSFADVWTALGGELKPSIDLVVSSPIELPPDTSVGPPVTGGLRLDAQAVSAGALPDLLGPDGRPLPEAGAIDDGRTGHAMHLDRIAIRRTRR